MSGARLEKTRGVFAGICRGFFRAENDADASRSFAAVEWHYSERLLHYANRSHAPAHQVLHGCRICHVHTPFKASRDVLVGDLGLFRKS